LNSTVRPRWAGTGAPPNKGMEPTAQKTRRGSCPGR